MTADLIPASTRRELLRGGLSAGAAASAIGLLGAPTADGRGLTDALVLHRLLSVEQVLVFAYEHVVGAGVLRPATRAAIEPFLGHEREHARELAAALSRRAAAAPSPPANIRVADRALADLHVTASLTALKTERDAVELLIGAEAGAIGAYYVAMSKLLDASLLQRAAQAMADEAQHATVLRRVLHPRSVAKYVPSAFVEGTH